MKVLLAGLTFLFSFNCLFGQQPTFHVHYSEPLAVYVFIKNLSENYPDNSFKTLFQQSKYHNEKYRQLVKQFDDLDINYTYSYNDFPYGSKIPGMVGGILKKNLIASNTIDEFKLKSVGLITNNTLSQLSTILSEFIPVYNELVYIPNQQKFEKQLVDISAFVEEKNIPDYFKTGLLFYNAVWDNSIPFEIVFYPLPDSKGFTAEAFFNNSVSAIQTDLKDYNSLLSVMLHEIYHILYNEQSLEVKKEITDYFKSNPSKCSNYAYLLLNEVLATALGNGYVYGNLNGEIDSKDWYNWKYINLMAKQIYPTLVEYIKNKKAIDKNFVDSYIKLYEQNYPNWINELDHVMTYRYILSNNISDFGLFRQLYPYCSMFEAEDQITEVSIDKMKETILTKVIIVSQNNAAQLKLIKEKFPELSNHDFKPEEEFVYNTFLNDKTQLYVINQLGSSVESLIKKLENKQE